jgi:hypothetical protein
MATRSKKMERWKAQERLALVPWRMAIALKCIDLQEPIYRKYKNRKRYMHNVANQPWEKL